MSKMRWVKWQGVLAILGSVLLVLTGCGGNNADIEEAESSFSRLTLQLNTPDALFDRSSSQASFDLQQQIDTLFTNLVVRVSGDDFEDITVNCPIGGPIDDQCRGITETEEEIIIAVALVILQGNNRRITISASLGNLETFRSTEDSNNNGLLEVGEDTDGDGILEDEITINLSQAMETAVITLRPITRPAELLDLENLAFTFENGSSAPLGIPGPEALLAVGNFVEDTAPFRLTAPPGDLQASGSISVAPCVFNAATSTFPPGQIPQQGVLPFDPCEVVVVNGRLVMVRTDTGERFTSELPSSIVADLAIVKMAPATVGLGQILPFLMTVTNNGPSSATNVVLSDPLPATVSFVLADPSQGNCDPPDTTGTVTCNLGSLAPNATVTVTLNVTPDTVGILTNTASVMGTEPDPNATNDSNSSSTMVPDPPVAVDLVVSKTADPEPVSPGQNLTYTIEVDNIGLSTATQVTITDMLPVGVTFQQELSSQGCQPSPPGTVTCGLPTLAPNNLSTLAIVVSVDETTTGTLANTVTVASAEPDLDPSNNSATVNTTAARPGPFSADAARPSNNSATVNTTAAFVVNNAPDLVDAINLANDINAESLIVLGANITLGTSDVLPDITSTVTINGNGTNASVIQPGPNSVFRIFAVGALGNLTLNDLTIQGGLALSGTEFDLFNGGGILNNGIVTLLNSTITDNSAQGNGGGISNNGTLTITNSTIADNSSDLGTGGGIFNSGTLIITNSTIYNNKSFNSGGGIGNNGTSTIINNTIVNNSVIEVGNDGGGIFNSNSGMVNLQNTILVGNMAPDNGKDCSGPVISQGNNLIENPAGCGITLALPSDITDESPNLGGFTDSGAPGTGHLPLLFPSPAIDAGNAEACANNPLLATDQLGQPRTDGDNNGTIICDIGAVELTP